MRSWTRSWRLGSTRTSWSREPGTPGDLVPWHGGTIMKVKMFEDGFSLSGGVGQGSDGFVRLEKQINDFLADNSRVKVVDLRLTSNAAPVGDYVTHYIVVAVLLYEELT